MIVAHAIIHGQDKIYFADWLHFAIFSKCSNFRVRSRWGVQRGNTSLGFYDVGKDGQGEELLSWYLAFQVLRP